MWTALLKSWWQAFWQVLHARCQSVRYASLFSVCAKRYQAYHVHCIMVDWWTYFVWGEELSLMASSMFSISLSISCHFWGLVCTARKSADSPLPILGLLMSSPVTDGWQAWRGAMRWLADWLVAASVISMVEWGSSGCTCCQWLCKMRELQILLREIKLLAQNQCFKLVAWLWRGRKK